MRNEAELFELLREAAELGDAQAQFELRLYYLKGEAVVRDEAEAVKWAQMAAEQGHIQAQAFLSNCYDFGIGVKKCETEALKWLHLAAEQGDGNSQFKLAVRYGIGSANRRNDIEAFKWAILASLQGPPFRGAHHAEQILSTIEQHLTPEQRAEGKRLAVEWQIKFEGVHSNHPLQDPEEDA